MNIFSHTTEMIGKGTISSYIALAIVGVAALLALIGAWRGFRRGAARQTIRLITIAISLVASAFIVITLNDKLLSMFDGMTVQDILEKFNLTATVDGLSAPLPEIINRFEVEALQHLIAVPVGLVIVPILFVVLFVLISAIMLFVHAIVSTALGFHKNKNNIVTRLVGLAIGAVQGVCVAAILFVPLSGVCTMLRDTVEELGEPEKDIEKTFVEVYDEYARDLAESPFILAVDKCGGGWLNDKFAEITINGEKEDVRETLPTVIGLITELAKLTDIDFNSITEDDKDNIRSLIDKIGDDKFTASLLAAAVGGAAESMESGDIPVDSIQEPFTSFVHSILKVLETTNSDTVAGDLTTITNALFILSDSGVLSYDGEEAVDLLIEKDENGKTVVNKITEEFNKNERTKVLVTQLTKLSITLMMNATSAGSGHDADMDVQYDELKGGMNSITTLQKDSFETEEEYMAAVTENLNQTLTASGIELEPEVVDNMAVYVADNYGESGELSDEEFNDIMLNYYDSYVEYKTNGTVPDDFQNPDDTQEPNPDDTTDPTPDDTTEPNPDDTTEPNPDDTTEVDPDTNPDESTEG